MEEINTKKEAPAGPKLSPVRLMLISGAAIFTAEAVIMLLFIVLPPPSAMLEVFIDASLLVLFTSPILYWFWYRPLMRQLAEHARISAEIRDQALHDVLTGLPNRGLFENHLQHAIEIARRDRHTFALILLDVRRFKEINNALGHGNGDDLLRQIAVRLRDGLRRSDTIARLGADQFGILLRKIPSEGAAFATEKLQSLMEPPFPVEQLPIELEVTSGIALFPDHGEDPALLLRRADIALTEAKRNVEAYSIYTLQNDDASLQRLTMFGMLRHAIQHDELLLHYQPKIELSTGRLAGVEALVRWRHPKLGTLPPGEFIPLAEQSNLIKPLTFWVIEQTLRQISEWSEHGIPMNVAINLSARNLSDSSLPQRMNELLSLWRVAPSDLTCEVTESAIMAHPQRATNVLNGLRQIGLSLALDDFGTGQSSLTYLRTLPADELKIDRSFVSKIETDEGDAAIVRSIIDLAHHLGLSVTAEGVETEETLKRLRELGCDRAQGYFISRPLPALELTRWVNARSRPGSDGQASEPDRSIGRS